MCKEDIRLARAAKPNPPIAVAVPGGVAQVLPGNWNRYSLSLAALTAAPVANNCSGMLAAKVGGLYWPLLVATSEHQGGTINLVDVGAVIYEAIWWVPQGNDAFDSVFVGDSQWLQTVESI